MAYFATYGDPVTREDMHTARILSAIYNSNSTGSRKISPRELLYDYFRKPAAAEDTKACLTKLAALAREQSG